MLNTNESDEYKTTYNNRKRYVARILEEKDITSSLEQLCQLIDPEEVDFSIACLSEFYHYKFVKEVVEASTKKIQLVKSKLKTFSNEQQENINFLIKKLEHRIENCELEPSYKKTESNIETQPVKRRDEDKLWFKTGIHLANGKAYELYDKGLKRGEIATTLGFKRTTGVYFSESIGNSSTRSKNLYTSEKNYLAVYDYCMENNLKICDKFKINGKQHIENRKNNCT
jgi:hypothetical protein